MKRYALFAALLGATALAGPALAADLAVKAPVYKAPPAPAYVAEWGGFYIGGHGGYGWGDTDTDETELDGPRYGYKYDYLKYVGKEYNYKIHQWVPKYKTVRNNPGSHVDRLTTDLDGKPKGAVFGVHAGYNWQFGSIVTGVEGDFDGADLKTSGEIGSKLWDKKYVPNYGTVTTQINPTVFDRSIKFDELATLRARLGYLLLPNLLAYGTGGGAWGHSEVSWTATNAGTPDVTGSSFKKDSFGWVAGGGLEYKLWEHILVRAEYLHYDFGKVTYDDGISAKSTIDVVRGGLSYKF